MAGKAKDQYFLADRTVVRMIPLSISKSYDLDYYEGSDPTPRKLPVYKLTLACPTVGHDIRKSDLMNPNAAPGTAVPSVEVCVAIYKAPESLRPVFWEGPPQTPKGQMFVSMKGGRDVLRGSLFDQIRKDTNIDIGKEGACKPLQGKTIQAIWVRVGYMPGKDTSWAPKNTYRGHAVDKSYFEAEELTRMGDLAGATVADSSDSSSADNPLAAMNIETMEGGSPPEIHEGEERPKGTRKAESGKKKTSNKKTISKK